MTPSKIRELLAIIEHDQIREDLTKIVDLVDNPIFLKGIGERADECLPVSDFKVIQSYEEAQKRMVDQEMWDLPEPWPYQYFPGIFQEENGRLMYGNGLSTEELERIDKYCANYINPIRLYYYEKIDYLIVKYDVQEIISNEYISDNITHMIGETLSYLIHFCTYGGFAASPILCRFYEAFLTGGAPCSWVGSLPEDGGDPKECLQILYRGPVTDPSLIVG